MATVHSLICWGGASGKSITVVPASDTLTLNSHGLRDGTGVAFTAGSLPTVTGAALALNTTYYAKASGSNAFELYRDAGLTSKIDFTSSGAGLVMKSAYYLGLTDTSRWSDRIYDSLAAWNTGRASASPFDTEVCEIGMAWDDVKSGGLTINVPAAEVIVTTRVNGTRSAGFHNFRYDQGYAFTVPAFGGNALMFGTYRVKADGFVVHIIGHSGIGGIYSNKAGAKAHNMIVYKDVYGDGGNGIAFDAQLAEIVNCVASGFSRGLYIYSNANGCLIANNVTAGNNFGFGSNLTQTRGYYYNNISIGNVSSNWPALTGQEGASNNAGLAADTVWGANTVAITTGAFASWNATEIFKSDFRPAAISSPQVDTGTDYFGRLPYDAGENEVPNYYPVDPGKIDLGPYEFDHGYGLTPQSQPVQVSDIVDGSRIKIAKQAGGAELYNAVLSGSTSISYTESLSVNTPVYLYVRKGSAAPFFKPLRLGATIDSVQGLNQSLAGLQIADIARAASYPAEVATDWTFNAETGAITHIGGSTRHTVRSLYSYYRDYTDDSTTVDDTLLMDGTTPTVFSLINTGNITDAHLQYLKGGSIEFQDGTLWSNVYSVGALSGTPDVYLYQGSTKLTAFWPAGHIDILVKAVAAGAPVSGGQATGYAREFGYTYDHYEVDMSSGGRNVMPLASLADPSITDAEATVAGWSDIAVSFGAYSLDFSDGDGAQTYYARIDCNGRPLAQVYQRMQYLTRGGSSASLNGVAGERYQSAHPSMAPIKTAPFGVYSGGVWSLAPGVWLDNVASGDLYNFVLTDAAGGAHQNVAALFQSVSIAGVLAGSRVQIYDTTNDLELFNDIAATSTVSWQDAAAPTVDRAIRLRVAYVNGANARNFIEASIGTCGTAAGNKDVSYLVSQTPDAIYNANAIDGSTVAGITFTDASVDTMNININAGQVNLGQLYAAWVWYAFSEAGIATDIDYIHAIDQANYVYTNLRWKNTTSPAVPLKITGGYAWDSVTEDPTDLVDVTGGTVFLTPPHVVAKTITVTGGSVITGDVGDLPTAAQVASAVLAAATSTPIHADTKRMNGVALLGTGTTADKWRGE